MENKDWVKVELPDFDYAVSIFRGEELVLSISRKEVIVHKNLEEEQNKRKHLVACPVCKGSGNVPESTYEYPGQSCSYFDYIEKMNKMTKCRICNGTGMIEE